MSRISIPSLEDAPEASKAALDGVHKQLGVVPNLFRLIAVSPQEIALNRKGASSDAKANAAVAFAYQVAQQRGHVADADITAVGTAGFTDAQIVEIVALVAENTFTNYLNEVARTDIDFPAVHAGESAEAA